MARVAWDDYPPTRGPYDWGRNTAPGSTPAPQPYEPPAPTRGPYDWNPTATPVETRPFTPPQLNAAGRGVSAEQYYRDYLQNFGVTLRQSQAAGWDDLINALKTEGYNYTLDQRTDGLHKGLYEGGDPNKFVKILDGMDRPIWMPGGNQSAAGGGGGSDPRSELYFNELLERMRQLREPVNDPLQSLYQLQGMQRIQDLQGKPFTEGEDAALVAQYMNPLTQARDAELQQNKERIGARGMLPSSGLLDELNKGTGQSYQQGVAQGSNQLAVRAVDERQRRQQEALSTLTSMLGQSRGMRNEQDQRANELIDLASQFPAFDERRLDQLLRASGGNDAAQGAGALLSQQSQQLQQQLLQANNDAQRDAAWGAFFGSILNNWDSIF